MAIRVKGHTRLPRIAEYLLILSSLSKSIVRVLFESSSVETSVTFLSKKKNRHMAQTSAMNTKKPLFQAETYDRLCTLL